MRRLTGVELTRLRWRRAVLLLLLIAVAAARRDRGGPGLVDPARCRTPRSRAAAQNGASEIARCVDAPAPVRPRPANATEQQCTDLIVGWYTGREQLEPGQRAQAARAWAWSPSSTAALLLAGTTFVGHDWNTGSMSNQLLFEPRRGRIWTAKALAVTLMALVDRGRREHGVLARHLGDHADPRPADRSTAPSPTRSPTGCAAPGSRPRPRWAATP